MIPQVKAEITVADTLIFFAMLLYGGEAAILLAAAHGLVSSLHVSRSSRAFLFNSAQMAVQPYCLGTFFLVPLSSAPRGVIPRDTLRPPASWPLCNTSLTPAWSHCTRPSRTIYPCGIRGAGTIFGHPLLILQARQLRVSPLMSVAV